MFHRLGFVVEDFFNYILVCFYLASYSLFYMWYILHFLVSICVYIFLLRNIFYDLYGLYFFFEQKLVQFIQDWAFYPSNIASSYFKIDAHMALKVIFIHAPYFAITNVIRNPSNNILPHITLAYSIL